MPLADDIKTLKLPINEIPYKNADTDAVNILGEVLINGVIETIPGDNKKISSLRPGLGTAKVDLGTGVPIDGLYWWNGRKIVLAVSDGKVFKITNTAGTLTATQLADDTMDANHLVTFTEAGSTLTGFKALMAAGGTIHFSDDAVTLSEIADPDAPTTVTHVAFIDSYILANVTGSGQFNWSQPGDIEDWRALGFASTEAKTDDLIALLVSYREIFLMGEQTIEVWYNDGVSPFSRVTMVEYGLLAAYSACFDGGDLYFLNHNKRVCRLVNGRNPEILSTPYDKFIQTNIETVADMYSYLLNVEGKKLYVCQFPTDKKTLVYDIMENAWYEWGTWNIAFDEPSDYSPFLGRTYAYCPTWAMNLVGSTIDGKIYDLSFDNRHDNGDNIRFLKRTGHINHGTALTKRSHRLIINATSGAGLTDGSEDFFTFRFRDDGRKEWSNERKVSLGEVGEYKDRKYYPRLGIYQKRQYEFVHSSRAPFTLIEAEEQIELLGR